MPVLTVRNLPDDVHRALRIRAAEHGRSTEAEVRDILANAVKPSGRLRMGDAMVAAAREAGFTHAEVDALEASRNRTPAEPIPFE